MKNHIRLSFVILVLALGALLAACGSLPAGAEAQVLPGSSNVRVEFVGNVDSIAADQWVVAGQKLSITPQTSIEAGILVGEMVKVHATVVGGAQAEADQIERFTSDTAATPLAGTEDNSKHFNDANHAEFTGVVQTVGAESWVISGVTFVITSQTEIKDTIVAGDTVKVEAAVTTDGKFTATEIRLFKGSELGTQAPRLDDHQFEMVGSVQAIAADQWNVSGKVFGVDASTEIKGEIKVGDLVKVEAQVRGDGTFLALEIKLDDLSSSTPQSGADDNSGLGMEFTGIVQSISPTSWTIGGKIFTITAQTEIGDKIAVGDTVKVESFGSLSGTLTAREIKKVDATGATPIPGSGDDHGGSSSTVEPPSTSGPGDDHGGGSSKP